MEKLQDKFKVVEFQVSEAPAKSVGKKYKNNKFNLIDKTQRSVLGEGRSYGMGFGFAKREDNNLSIINPISPCKDYLNDVIYSELTGKPYQAHGLSTKKQDIFNHGECYLVFSICYHYNTGTKKYDNYDRDYKKLDENYANLEKFINWFEDKFKTEQKTKIIKLEENKFLAIGPLFWTKGTYLISLYSLLIRSGFFYEKGEPMDYLKNFKYDNSDSHLINMCMDKIKKMLDGNVPKQNMSECDYPHNMGICSFNFN